jgi:hypothetical protein
MHSKSSTTIRNPIGRAVGTAALGHNQRIARVRGRKVHHGARTQVKTQGPHRSREVMDKQTNSSSHQQISDLDLSKHVSDWDCFNRGELSGSIWLARCRRMLFRTRSYQTRFLQRERFASAFSSRRTVSRQTPSSTNERQCDSGEAVASCGFLSARRFSRSSQTPPRIRADSAMMIATTAVKNVVGRAPILSVRAGRLILLTHDARIPGLVSLLSSSAAGARKPILPVGQYFPIPSTSWLRQAEHLGVRLPMPGTQLSASD